MAITVDKKMSKLVKLDVGPFETSSFQRLSYDQHVLQLRRLRIYNYANAG